MKTLRRPMQKRTRWPLHRSLAALTLALLPAFSPFGKAHAECGKMTIAEMSWSSAALAANVQTFILREGFGCEPELVPGDTVPTASSMVERGEPDIAPEMWVNSARFVIQRGLDEGRLIAVSQILVDGAGEGWYVPRYVVDDHPELTSLQAVRERPDLFPDKEEPGKGRFYGCPSGWACEIINANLFRAYGLDEGGFSLFNPGSGQGLAAAIARAYERREPIFTYYWSPTALLGRYDLVKLNGMAHDPETWSCITMPDCLDPAENMYPDSEVLTIVTSRFAEMAPEALGFISRFSWGTNVVEEMLAWMDENKATAEEGAERFLRLREDVWTSWVSDKVAEKTRTALR